MSPEGIWRWAQLKGITVIGTGDFTHPQWLKELKKKDTARIGRSRHVSGAELIEGLRVYALEQYGPLAKTVLNSWGVKRCSDFGDIVFNLIEYNVFSKTENDRREDFTAPFRDLRPRYQERYRDRRENHRSEKQHPPLLPARATCGVGCAPAVTS